MSSLYQQLLPKNFILKTFVITLIFMYTDLGCHLRSLFLPSALNTDDKLEYRFYPAATRQLQFRVKAANDAHVALTTGPQDSQPMYEVFIGGWGNSKSVIRKNKSKPDVAEADTPGILSNDEFRGFWIRWDDDALSVGKEGEASAFLTYTDSEPLTVSHFGLCTAWGASGEWLIEEGPSAPPAEVGDVIWCGAVGGMVPPNAIEGGRDEEPLFVGRARHEGALLPGKVKPSHSVCYVAWGGQEHGKSEYEVLCSANPPTWVPTSGNNIPPNAIPAGESEDGETLYVGRVHHEDTLTIGKVQPSHSVCYIPFAGSEVGFPEYEIMIWQ
ncbi:uncharacterized protein LOC122398776 isoform X5 [Colletes gigas]|uniref:uncharacterized protein LOC122398776 isoform X5 n=1 Tax=Colletes gigas TaxID=935657 RepID=UPI001C9A7540|nr:uncharacterized protein LOC122398776 isoform X5 [Colletes gigas]